ncbi:TonB-dependent receptor [Flavihumibacter solisilvae]|uniref:TonB-dependent receptor n=1 Tax=Flavihumibacter solisilvae TaxID=1349421 RepID=UPI001F081006|nr:TonB-dependent receptor [Flavihumibacter solisilvae]
MKLTALFLTVFCLQVAATGMAQETVTVSVRNTSLKKLFSIIQRQTNYRFLYHDGLVSGETRIDLEVSDMPVDQVLNRVLSNTSLSYRLVNKNLVVINRSAEMDKDITVRGKVTNEQGQPLEGVSVNIKGSKSGTVTSATGEFELEVPEGSVLVVSSIGFDSKEVTVNGNEPISLKMIPSSKGLEDVVVIGYGTSKKTTLTGSVSSVKGRELIQSPATNVSNSLVGRLPGLTAVTGSGEPGYDGSTLRIRGMNTLNNNDVLVVVDGIAGRSLDRIDPNSIESVTVLKDASAAIYGAQAANGVILVTTKRGKLGKPEISFNVNFGYNQPTRIPKMADAATYATMLNEIAAYNGSPAKYTDEEIRKFSDGSDLWKYPNTDWFDETLKKRSAQNAYNVTVSGGTDAMRYFVSLGAKTQEGNYYNSATKYNQYDFRSNLDGKINKYMSLAVDVAGRLEDRNYPVRGAGSIFRMVMRGKPTLPAYWPDGTPGPDIEYGDNPVVISTDATGYDKDKYYVLNTNLKLNISVPGVKGLTLTGNASFDKGFDFRKTWQTPWYLYTWDYNTYDADGNPVLVKGKRGFDDARLNEYSRDEITKTFYGLANYDTKIAGDHGIRLMVGSELRKGNADYFNAFRRYYASTAIDQLFAGGAAEINNGGSGWVNARLNYFGRVNYAFREKYLAEFVWRYDGSYIFPEQNRWGFFPGVSLGWRVSEEPFFANNINFIDNLKIRGSWGQTGNDRILEWQYMTTYAYGNFISSPYFPFVTNGSTENQTLYETRIPNLDVTWEKADQANIGFDMTMLSNRLSIEADYFNYKRSNILYPRNASIPASAGLTLPPENIGIVVNRGFDFNITYRNGTRDFSYSVGLNGGYAKNKIQFWDEAPGAPEYQRSTGHPMSTGLYYEAIGVFHDASELDKYPHWSGAKPGDLIFADLDKNGVIDPDDRKRVDKSTVPTFTGGLNLSLQYKGFDLALLFQAATGAVNYINTESGEIGNYLQSFADGRWTTGNPTSDKPRAFNRGNEYWASNNNTYFLLKTDYVRLKNLQLGYTLPVSLTQKAGMQQMRLYISGYNLLTYSPDYKDFDPEASAGSGQSYPLQRVLSAGATLTF